MTLEQSCSGGAQQYAIYEGTLGNWYDHSPATCSAANTDLVQEITPGAGDRYFLVVPINPNRRAPTGSAWMGNHDLWVVQCVSAT